MARDFAVKATIIAEDQASATLSALRGEFTELDGRINRLAASEKALAESSREATAETKNLAKETKQAEGAATQADVAFQKQLRTLLGFGSAVAVLATVQRAVRAIAGASEESQANFDALSNQISGVLTPAANSLSTVFGAFASTIRTSREASAGFADSLDSIASKTASLIPGLDTLINKFGELAEQERLTREAEEGIIATREKMAKATADAAKAANEETERSRKFQEDLVSALEKEAGAQFKANAEKKRAAEASREVTIATEQASKSTLVWSRALGIWIDTANVVNTEVGRMRSSYKGVREDVLLTARAFDELTAAQGRNAAVQAALDEGGSLSSNGRRVSIRSGSRLTFDPGLTGFVGRNPIGGPRIRRRSN